MQKYVERKIYRTVFSDISLPSFSLMMPHAAVLLMFCWLARGQGKPTVRLAPAGIIYIVKP